MVVLIYISLITSKIKHVFKFNGTEVTFICFYLIYPLLQNHVTFPLTVSLYFVSVSPS